MKILPSKKYIYLFFCLLSIIFLVIYNAYLNYESNSFEKSFISQNYKEIYSINTDELIKKLETHANSKTISCIKATYGHQKTVFYSFEQKDCKEEYFTKKIDIFISEADNLKFTFIYRLSLDFNLLFILFYFFTLLLFVLQFYSNNKINSLKNEFITRQYNLSRQMFHDIRSPLATLKSISENIIDQKSSDSKLLKLSIERINQISNSLLEETKENKLIKIDLISSIKNIIELKRHEHNGAEIIFKNHISQTLFIYGPPIEIDRILSNLINNAIEAATPSKVEISLDVISNILILTVKDFGKGFPLIVLENIGKKTITTKEKGNGLGLTHAQEMISKYDATIKFNNTENGAKVEILFKNFEKIESNYTSKVILIDDDELVQLTWKAKANRNKIALEIFRGKEDLFNQIDNYYFNDIFYIDSELGDDKGEEIAIELHRRGFTEIYMATGHSPDNFKHLPFLKGVIGKKPPF